ncbi:MAG: hypothetical protein WDW38_004570 [Sanguina aurantia]
MVMHKRLARGFRTACHTGRDKEQQQPAARMLSLGLSYEDDDDEEEAGTSGPSIAPASTGSKAPESASLPSVEQAADDSDSGEGMELDDEPCAVKGGGPDKERPGGGVILTAVGERTHGTATSEARSANSGGEGASVAHRATTRDRCRHLRHHHRGSVAHPPRTSVQRTGTGQIARGDDPTAAAGGMIGRLETRAEQGTALKAGLVRLGGMGSGGEVDRWNSLPVARPGGTTGRAMRNGPGVMTGSSRSSTNGPTGRSMMTGSSSSSSKGGDRSRHDERHQGGDRFQGRPDADRSQNGDRQQQQQQQQGGTGSRAGEGQTGGVMVTGVAMARPVAPTTTAAALTAAAEAGTEPVGMAGTGVGTGARDVTAVGGTRGGRGRRRGAALSNGAVSSKAHGRTEIRGALSAPLGGSSRGGREDSDELRGGAAAKRPRDASSERMPPVAAVPAGPVMSSADIVRAMMGAPRAAGDTTASAATMSLADKKKLLWGAKKKVEQPDVSHSHEEVAVPIQADAVFGKNRWDGAEWQTTEAKSKFQRMMGVKTDHAEMLAGTTAPPQHTDDDFAGHVVMTKDAQAKVLQDVEEHFHAALRRKDGRTVGLGL